MYLDEITIWYTTPSEYINEIKLSDTTTNIYGIIISDLTLRFMDRLAL